eukprot:31138-Pelagococcus_subviridis.AAC.2
MTPASRRSAICFLARPRTSSASRDAKCATRSSACAGHRHPPVHRSTAAEDDDDDGDDVASSDSSSTAANDDDAASPDSYGDDSRFFGHFTEAASGVLLTALPHAGHRVGVATTAPSSSPSATTRTTRGMTSPARSTTTRAPSLSPFLATSSKLCNVARVTVAPPRATGGSNVATGVSAPVRPTCTSTARNVVTAVSAANLCAVAHLGARLSAPRMRCDATSSTLYTTPSTR